MAFRDEVRHMLGGACDISMKHLAAFMQTSHKGSRLAMRQFDT